jgi:hypothetical protein
MSVDLNKIRRYERKYLVTPAQAEIVREFIRPFMAPDSHTNAAQGGYTVNNIYLDTPDLRFYTDVKTRRLRRFKPRMRYYGADPSGGLWLEVKNKHGEIIWKNRHRVPASAWPGVLEAQPAPEGDPVSVQGPRTFEDIVGLFPVRPVLHVRYFREAWVSELDDYGRLTFDTRLRCRPALGSTDLAAPEPELGYADDPVTTSAPDSMVLIEVKTETLVPWWAIEITKRAELWQRGFSKYCYGIERALFAPQGQGRVVNW